jgi:hypothetical protein
MCVLRIQKLSFLQVVLFGGRCFHLMNPIRLELIVLVYVRLRRDFHVAGSGPICFYLSIRNHFMLYLFHWSAGIAEIIISIQLPGLRKTVRMSLRIANFSLWLD